MILLRPYPGAMHLAQGLSAPAGGLTSQDPGAQLGRLRQKLRASEAPWKIVIGHHPPRSNGHHGNTEELAELLEPVFQVAIQARSHTGPYFRWPYRPVLQVAIQARTSGGHTDLWQSLSQDVKRRMPASETCVLGAQ